MTAPEDWEHHLVRVTVSATYTRPSEDVDPEDVHVAFSCDAPADAPCRTHPSSDDGCDCEAWYECDEDHDDPESPAPCGLVEPAASTRHDYHGHPYRSGQECWVKTWYDAGGSNAYYAGPDATDDGYRDDCVPPIARQGLIDVHFEGDYITWTWHGEPTTVDGQRPASQPIPGQGALDLDTKDGPQ